MSIHSPNSDKRFECRYRTRVECTVFHDGPSEPVAHSAGLIDVSQNGAMLACPKAIPLGTMVRVKIGEAEHTGEIVRATKRRVGLFRRVHLLGIRTPDPWPAGLFSRIAFPDTRSETVGRDNVFDQRGMK